MELVSGDYFSGAPSLFTSMAKLRAIMPRELVESVLEKSLAAVSAAFMLLFRRHLVMEAGGPLKGPFRAAAAAATLANESRLCRVCRDSQESLCRVYPFTRSLSRSSL